MKNLSPEEKLEKLYDYMIREWPEGGFVFFSNDDLSLYFRKGSVERASSDMGATNLVWVTTRERAVEIINRKAGLGE